MPQYNYSIIIPHKEIPELLMRCLRSIPERDDIQIIVVDDNSKDAETYLDRFPELSRPNLELYLTKEGKGAGYARNVGLEHALGNWLLFADSDDFFSNALIALLDKNREAEEDIIYFDFQAVMSDDVTVLDDRDSHAKIGQFLDDNCETIDAVRFMHFVPWAKMIKRSLVINNNISFQEIKWSNDVYFSTCSGVNAQKVRVVDKVIYVLTNRPGSLTYKKDKSLEELKVRLKAGIDSYNYAREKGYPGTMIICNTWTSMMLKRNCYWEVINAIKGLDDHALTSIYNDSIWGANMMQKLLYKILIIIARNLPC